MARVVLDSGVIIGLYNDNDSHHSWAVDFMFQSAADELHVSALNYAEVSVGPIKAGLADPFFSGMNGLQIKIDKLTTKDVMSLAQFRADTVLRMPDVCAMQLAHRLDGILATTDKSVAKAALDLGLQVFQP